jgi:hypothetical protein
LLYLQDLGAVLQKPSFFLMKGNGQTVGAASLVQMEVRDWQWWMGLGAKNRPRLREAVSMSQTAQ